MSKNKVNTKTLSGFAELLPEQQRAFDSIRGKIEEVFRARGFQNMDTPAVERAEILFSKTGGEINKEIFRVLHGDTEQALRFDLTVPFARYVAEHNHDLVFPFKRNAIGKSWRGERAQRGRAREFYQADIDTVAENGLPLAYDAEIILTIAGALSATVGRPFKVHVSSRRIWGELVFNAPLMTLIDKKRKITADEFERSLKELAGDDCPRVRNILAGKVVTPDLEEVLSLLPRDLSVFDPTIIRGLDYYTGTVFETFLDGDDSLGSIASGGRYENLVGNFSDRNIVGVGGSIGLTRYFLTAVLEGKIQATASPLTLVIPTRKEYVTRAFSLGCGILFLEKKLGKLFEIANRMGATRVVVIGDDEMKNGTLTLKDMATGEQLTAKFEDVAAMLKKH
ncbi:MAG: histidine--tRNA ligase family protein [Rickettsiales bacterium]|nr:histidine--tRNA ligase family protein [Rickettsiales bacterium]